MDFMNSPYEDYTTEELDAKEKQLKIAKTMEADERKCRNEKHV